MTDSSFDRVREETRLRELVVESYGGRCAHCGITEAELPAPISRRLIVHHKDGETGPKKRLDLGIAGEYRRILKEMPRDVGLLCPKCHSSEHRSHP